MLRTTRIHPRYGVQLHDIQLADVTVDSGDSEIRDAFEQHSLLYFCRSITNVAPRRAMEL